MVFRGYIDESYGPRQNVFAWSCLMAKGSHWLEFERKWKLHLSAKNRELKKAGRPLISRYHASDCSGCRGEFKGWDLNERDAFVLGLFVIFRQVPTLTIVFNTQLNDVCEIFPEWSADRLEAGYSLLTTALVYLLGQSFKVLRGGTGAKITLFHDQTAGNGQYDQTILRAFNKELNKAAFPYGDFFSTIAPLRWQERIALQPADLVAFECLKDAEARIEARKQRRSFTALLNMKTFGIRSKTMKKSDLLRLRGLIDKAQVVA